MKKLNVYLEKGTKRTFASVADWPGWSRSGGDEASALQALVDYAPRYKAALRHAHLDFDPPESPVDFKIAERLKGGKTTDFGTPGAIPKGDHAPLDKAQLQHLESVLRACWRTFDECTCAATSKSLRTGPRGGGRDLKKMISHVVEAQHAYITMSGWNWKDSQGKNTGEPLSIEQQREVALAALAASSRGELPTRGPRGGIRWPARYFVRREAWHVLDHAWEIEDRLE